MPTQNIELNQRLSPNAIELLEQINAADSKAVAEKFDYANAKLTLYGDDASDHQIQKTSEFHSRYAAHSKSRLKTLNQLYQALNSPSDVVVMLFCENFLPLFDTWLMSCERHNINVRDRLITFTLDQTSENRMTGMGIKSCFLDPAQYLPVGNSQAFGDLQFRRTMLYKNAVILDVLNLGTSVLFQDVDLIWFNDPFTYLNINCSHGDIWAMYDGPNQLYAPVYANSGFLYIRPTNISKAVFETALGNSTSILQAGGHQSPLNQIFDFFIQHKALHLEILPQHLFLNGHLFNLVTGVGSDAGDWQDNGIVFHYSWTIDRKEKIEKLDKFGMNYLNLKSYD